MTFREGPFQELRFPVTWTAAGATILALLIALALLLTDHRQTVNAAGYGAARNEFDELIEPVAGVLSAPVRWTGEAVNYVRGYFFAVSENRRLRHEVGELQRWRDAAIALKNVNDRYEALLKLRTEPPIPTVSARVVLDARGPFANARLADAGAEHGVRVGNPVMSEHGVAGRVVGVTRGASRFLMLTDVDSRTPVLVDRTNARAILTGDGGQYPRLDYLRGRAPVNAGDLILSSGDGGVFPRGLPVGVAARDVKGVWRARLYADRAPIDYVRILVFEDFSQLVSPAALSAGGNLPPLTAQERADLQAALTPPAPKPPPPQPSGAKTAATAVVGAAAAVGAVVTPAPATAPATPGPLRPGPLTPTPKTKSVAAEPVAAIPKPAPTPHKPAPATRKPGVAPTIPRRLKPHPKSKPASARLAPALDPVVPAKPKPKVVPPKLKAKTAAVKAKIKAKPPAVRSPTSKPVIMSPPAPKPQPPAETSPPDVF